MQNKNPENNFKSILIWVAIIILLVAALKIGSIFMNGLSSLMGRITWWQYLLIFISIVFLYEHFTKGKKESKEKDNN